MPIPDFVKTLPGRNSSATHELVFLALNLPPLGSKSFYIQVENKSKAVELINETNGAVIANKVGYNLNNLLLIIFSRIDFFSSVSWFN